LIQMNLKDFNFIFWPDGLPPNRKPQTKKGIGLVWVDAKNRVHIGCEDSPLSSLSLNNIQKFITEYNLKNIVIVDTFSGVEEPAYVKDHVNRSGINLLRSHTPFGKGPMFPDMSHIYTAIDDLKAVVVHTLGPNYWDQKATTNHIWSRWSGIVAPVFHYFDLNVATINQEALRKVEII